MRSGTPTPCELNIVLFTIIMHFTIGGYIHAIAFDLPRLDCMCRGFLIAVVLDVTMYAYTMSTYAGIPTNDEQQWRIVRATIAVYFGSCAGLLTALKNVGEHAFIGGMLGLGLLFAVRVPVIIHNRLRLLRSQKIC
jgi:hypothetical protein